MIKGIVGMCGGSRRRWCAQQREPPVFGDLRAPDAATSATEIRPGDPFHPVYGLYHHLRAPNERRAAWHAQCVPAADHVDYPRGVRRDVNHFYRTVIGREALRSECQPVSLPPPNECLLRSVLLTAHRARAVLPLVPLVSADSALPHKMLFLEPPPDAERQPTSCTFLAATQAIDQTDTAFKEPPRLSPIPAS